jgi:HD-GYP domain-containing protein (c-di-GMP phosphodiesterase class II)
MMQDSTIKPGMLEKAGIDEQIFVNSLFILFKTAQLVDSNNASYVSQSSRFYIRFRKLADELGKVTVKVIEGRIFVCDKIVKFDTDGLVRAQEIMDRWQLLGIGGIVLDDSLDNRQIDKFIYLTANVNERENNYEEIARELSTLGINGITILGVRKPISQKQLPKNKRLLMRRTARVTFFRAITVVEDAMIQTAQNKDINLSKTKRVVHALIDRVSEDESSLIELTNIRDFDEYTYAHCANVCVYSLTMGVKLGLDRRRLSQLGFAALFHDMGKVKLPEDLIRKPDAFDEYDWIQMQQHPILGAKTILRNLKLDHHTARAALVAYEHHINFDFTGYPMLKNKRPTNLFSRIIAIADSFDALSSGRVYIKRQITPDEVIRKLMYQMTVKFDPFLLKLFVNIIGIYPPGTLVLLSSGELAVVSQANSSNLARPIIKIIGNKDGTYDEYVETDLSAAANADKNIIRIIDPRKYDIDIKSIILADKPSGLPKIVR